MNVRRLLAALGCLSSLQFADTALAGPVELMSQVVLQPGDPKTIVVRYVSGGGGLVYTRDSGASWQLLCSTAADPALTRSGSLPLALTGDGKTMFGVIDGLRQDDGNGCAWSEDATFAGLWVRDLVADPSDSTMLYVITSTDGMQNGIWRRDASGGWSELGSREDIQIIDLKVVARGTGLRFYQSMSRGTTITKVDGVDVPLPNVFVRVSDDDGETWQEHAVPSGDGNLRLRAIDPTDPDRIVTTIEREGSEDSVMVSDDQGATFTEYLKVGDFGGLAFAPDGRFWVGEAATTVAGAARGLWFAENLDTPAKKLADSYTVRCLAHEATTDTLYACQNFAFGTVAADGAFTAALKFLDVAEFVSCPGGETSATCKAQMCRDYCGAGHFAASPLCGAYDEPECGPCADGPTTDACIAATAPPVTGMPPDAGAEKGDAATTAKPDAGSVSPSGDKKKGGGSSCAALGAPAPHSHGGWVLGLCVALAARWRRRRTAP